MDAKVFKTVKVLIGLAAVALISAMEGCAGPPKRNPVPPVLTTQVGIPGIEEARFWGDEWPTFAKERIEKFTEADFREYFSGIYNKPHNYLAVSGGGANGAFGAGLLVGWSESGTRPEFTTALNCWMPWPGNTSEGGVYSLGLLILTQAARSYGTSGPSLPVIIPIGWNWYTIYSGLRQPFR